MNNDDMMFDNNQEKKLDHELDSVDNLERDLYNPNKEHLQRNRRTIHARNIELEKDFSGESYDEVLNSQRKFKLPDSLFKKVFFGAVGFFLLVLIFVAASLYQTQKTVSEDLIAFEIVGQPFVDGGEELEVELRIQNFNDLPLELPDVVISYPKDSSPDAERVFLRRALDEIGSGQRVTQDFDMTLFGQEGDIRQLEATLEYRIDGSNSIFIKQATHDVIIRSTPTQISLDAPKTVVRNQEVTLGINVSSNSSEQISGTILKIQYPRGFEFISSTIPPDFANNTWYVDSLADSAQSFEIVGRMAGLAGQGQTFTLEYGKQSAQNNNQIETVYNSLVHTIDIEQAFVDALLRIDNQQLSTVPVRGGSDVDLRVQYENTLDEPIENFVLTLRLDGDVYDTSSIRVLDGYYNSSNQTIVFDRTTREGLAFLSPGEEGEITVGLRVRDLVSATETLNNPEATISVDIDGILPNGQRRSARGVTQATIKANSDIAVLPKTLYTEGPFENVGVVPPKMNRQTSYTLLFQVTNSSNEVRDAVLKTTLPQYVEWKYVVAPSLERNNVNYNENTRELTWRIGTIPAGVGFGGKPPRELYGQIIVVPSVTHVGSPLNLTQDIVLSGSDAFTGVSLNYKKSPLQNRLEDRNAEGADGVVTE